MTTTARVHFNEDIQRAEAMLDQAGVLEGAGADQRLCQDVRIAAIAFSVGAMDAYLCDKYVDCLTKVLRAYVNGGWLGDLPASYKRSACRQATCWTRLASPARPGESEWLHGA